MHPLEGHRGAQVTKDARRANIPTSRKPGEGGGATYCMFNTFGNCDFCITRLSSSQHADVFFNFEQLIPNRSAGLHVSPQREGALWIVYNANHTGRHMWENATSPQISPQMANFGCLLRHLQKQHLRLGPSWVLVLVNALEITLEQSPLASQILLHGHYDRSETWVKNGLFSPRNRPPRGTTAWHTPYSPPICIPLMAQSL